MKHWLRILVGIIEAAIVLCAVYFEPTYCVRGILWREAFFEGRPTSYWRAELEQWNVTKYSVTLLIDVEFAPPFDNSHGSDITVNAFSREPSWFERQRARWLPSKNNGGVDSDLGPTLLHGNPNAIPVLHALLDDPSPRVRQLVYIGLKLPPELLNAH